MFTRPRQKRRAHCTELSGARWVAAFYLLVMLLLHCKTGLSMHSAQSTYPSGICKQNLLLRSKVWFAYTISVTPSIRLSQVGPILFQYWGSPDWPQRAKGNTIKILVSSQITRAHGNAGAVRAQFRKNLPGQALVRNLSRPWDHPNSGIEPLVCEGWCHDK